MNNQVLDAMVTLGLTTPEALEPYYPQVRDNPEIEVLRCRRTGALLLSRSDHQDPDYHEAKQKLTQASTEEQAYHDALFRQSITDDQLRAHKHESLILNQRWLDVGTGGGGILQLLGRKAKTAHGVEPNRRDREHLQQHGTLCFASIDDVPENPPYDVVTLFHVLEHIQDQPEFLRAIRRRMAPGGTLVVEVPHARDLLLSLFDLNAFKQFTFWSEHLVLHTRTTLLTFLQAAGFQRVTIEGIQRYPLANHLRWLVEGKPNGHRDWSHLRAEDLDTAYANLLARLDMTDTLLATAIA
ncbi:MAG: class I SAM-dependent methyltransferase [Magnetococcales bacterium]|nr:class I SAM-dependent methyltransferase [Magnetococcales bacterium]